MDDLEKRRAEAIKENRCFSVTRLRDEFRMKPAPGAEPVKIYKNAYGGKFGIYRLADCMPMRAKATPTEKQIAAGNLLGIRSQLNSKKGLSSACAAGWLDASAVFLDTETTGLSNSAQAVEIGVTDLAGNVLMDVRLKPTVPIEEGAESIHGIGMNSLADAPSWPDIEDELRRLLTGKPVIIFNAAYDMAILRQTACAFGAENSWLATVDNHCAMYLAAKFYGATNRRGTISLAAAVECAGVEWRGKPHSATGDAATTAAVVNAIADYSRRLTAMR